MRFTPPGGLRGRFASRPESFRLGSRTVASGVLGYLIGTLPSADIAARGSAHEASDLRDVGSGNPGASNAALVLGKRWGAAVLVADVGKGIAAASVGERLAGGDGAAIAGAGAVFGHCHPAWKGFDGGKGVATALGQAAVTVPGPLPWVAALALAAISPPWPRRSLVGAGVGAVGWIGGSQGWRRHGYPNRWGRPVTGTTVTAATLSALVIGSRFLSAERRHRADPPERAPDDASHGAPLRVGPGAARETHTTPTPRADQR